MPAAPVPDRIAKLKAQSTVTGIDYIDVHDDQTTLDVHFHVAASQFMPPIAANVQIIGPSGEAMDVGIPNWIAPDILQLTVPIPGGFERHTLLIEDAHVDPYYNSITFSFKANCPSDLDCAPDAPHPPAEDAVDFPVNYLARDFWSFRRALLDFASLRYPDWQDRLAADAGVMLAEVMSAFGDEMAYYQDRIAREAYLETATQRRSLRHHARLVDYHLDEGRTATTWLDVAVAPGPTATLAAGTSVWAKSDDGREHHFEVGHGLAEILDASTNPYQVAAVTNSLVPHIWDEDDTHLPVGATQIVVVGHEPSALLFPTTLGKRPGGCWMLLKDVSTSPGSPARRWMVRITDIENTNDPILNVPITRLQWATEHALPFELDLEHLEVRGNLVPAVAGYTAQLPVGAQQLIDPSYLFSIGPLDIDPNNPNKLRKEFEAANLPLPTPAIERLGPNRTITFRYSLPGSNEQPLCWLGDSSGGAKPEIVLEQMKWNDPILAVDPDHHWEWRHSLLGVASSQPGDEHFTLEDGYWDRVVGYQRHEEEFVHRDYASDVGTTVRFGAGEFGLIPAKDTIFRVRYRLGNGRSGNIAADSLTKFDKSDMPNVVSITNPLPVTDGRDPESARDVRELAPEAFRSVTYRAVRPEDYAEAAERLDWVSRAGATFRFTGSWLTGFVTPDPKGAVTLADAQQTDLTRQMDRFRQAGREVHVAAPVYADIDLEITICVEPFAYRGDVKERVLDVLQARSSPGGRGFFSSDNFTFGTPLSRSQLESVIQRVEGVRAVEHVKLRRRGHFDWLPLDGEYAPVGEDAVIRVENDLDHPDRGSLLLVMEGGA